MEQWTLEEIFEECGITPQEVIAILVKGGHIELPEWLTDRELYDGQDEET